MGSREGLNWELVDNDIALLSMLIVQRILEGAKVLPLSIPVLRRINHCPVQCLYEGSSRSATDVLSLSLSWLQRMPEHQW